VPTRHVLAIHQEHSCPAICSSYVLELGTSSVRQGTNLGLAFYLLNVLVNGRVMGVGRGGGSLCCIFVIKAGPSIQHLQAWAVFLGGVG